MKPSDALGGQADRELTTPESGVAGILNIIKELRLYCVPLVTAVLSATALSACSTITWVGDNEKAPVRGSANPETAPGMFLNSTEYEMICIINEVRLDPKAFAEKYLKDDMSPKGRETYLAMREMPPMGVLIPSRGLSYSAQDHAIDLGTGIELGHTGSDGSSPGIRTGRYTWISGGGGVSENCAFNYLRPLDIILEFLKSPGHRANILRADSESVGVAIRPRDNRSWTTVQNFGRGTKDRNNLPHRPPFDWTQMR